MNIAFQPHPHIKPHERSGKATRKFLQDMMVRGLENHLALMQSQEATIALERMRPEKQMVVAAHLLGWLKGGPCVQRTASWQAALLDFTRTWYQAGAGDTPRLDLEESFIACVLELHPEKNGQDLTTPASVDEFALGMTEINFEESDLPEIAPVDIREMMMAALEIDLTMQAALIASDYMEYATSDMTGRDITIRIVPARCLDVEAIRAFMGTREIRLPAPALA
jgi:hypothetical protein